MEHDTQKLMEINNEAVRLGLVSQHDANLCTNNGKSLQYRIDMYYLKLNDPERYTEERKTARRTMWEV